MRPDGPGCRVRREFLRGLGQGHGAAGHARKAMIYLYTHREPTPKVLVTDVRLLGGLPPPPPPPPPPVPPQYEQAQGPAPRHSLGPRRQADRGHRGAGVGRLPGRGRGHPASDREADRREGADRRRRLAGSRRAHPRQSHRAGQSLHQQDDQRPLRPATTAWSISSTRGPEGYVVRSVHNPFGDGHSVVIVGGSDAAGRRRRAPRRWPASCPRRRRPKGELSIGWTMETKLGKGVKPPTDIKEFETWEASKGYGSVGYFGWCSISKRMAMYYMTGDEFSAREVVRLSFPDQQAMQGHRGDRRRADREQARSRWPGSTTTTPTWRSCSGT